MIEIEFDPTGGPYSTLYVSETHMYLDSPNGRNAVRIPDSLYKELKKFHSTQEERNV